MFELAEAVGTAVSAVAAEAVAAGAAVLAGAATTVAGATGSVAIGCAAADGARVDAALGTLHAASPNTITIMIATHAMARLGLRIFVCEN